MDTTGSRRYNVSSLRAQILRLRVPIHGSDRYFIPQDPLVALLTKEVVHKAVAACTEIKIYQVPELVDIILRGAIKVFAILVLLKGEEGLIVRFVEDDGFQQTALDARLPLHRSQIEALVPEETVDDFDDRQWEFIVPFFSKAIIHRVMAPQVRLPFILDKDTGKEGGFGRIYEIQIHPDYHDFQVQSGEKKHLRLIRKEFLPAVDGEGDYKQETDNLNILNQIEHANIIRMFGSYTYRGKHNAIFPLATGGDLALFMAQEVRPEPFTDDLDVYRALSELSSAIEVVHNYSMKHIDLNLIGVHHDLKPQNILVHDGTFILADFGLTRFKSTDLTSKSLFKIGGGHYLAPECEDYEEAFRKNMISRPSDIWSFGCVLAEMLTYMHRGAEGVVAFRMARKVKVAGFTTYTFHAGTRTPNTGVVDWLDQLSKDFPKSPIIDFIKGMLDLDPSLRPDAATTTTILRFTALGAYARDIRSRFESLRTDFASHELEAQQRLFEAWHETLILWDERQDKDDSCVDAIIANLEAMLQHLEDIRKEVRIIALRYHKATSPLFHNLRHLNEELIELLPTELRRHTYSLFELFMAQHDDAIFETQQQQSTVDRSAAQYRRLAMLATMRHMNNLTQNPSDQQRLIYHLPPNVVRIVQKFDDHALGMLRRPSAPSVQLVLVENIQYDTHWEGAVREELLSRMVTATHLLRRLSEPGNLPILPCQGFYHIPQRFSFGLVFECPPSYLHDDRSVQETPTEVHSLATIISETAHSQDRPSLDDRFHLAKVVASTLLDFHKAGWLHKSISPYNIISFKTKQSKWAESLRMPYIIGFNRSRQDIATAFTEGPNATDKSIDYLHPRYIKEKCRFTRSFDYYSLGLVLLEIGLWEPLHTMLQYGLKLWPTKMSPMALDKLQARIVPMLKHTMGYDYFDAIRLCLSWDTTTDEAITTEEQRADLLLQFEQLVVERIRRCSMSGELRDWQPSDLPVANQGLASGSLRQAAAAASALPTASLPRELALRQKDIIVVDAPEPSRNKLRLKEESHLQQQVQRQSESDNLSTPKARAQPFSSGESQVTRHLVASNPSHQNLEDTSGLETPRPPRVSRTFPRRSGIQIPQPTAAQLARREADAKYRKEHHLGLRGFDDQPLSSESEDESLPAKELWGNTLYRTKPDEEIDHLNPLGLFADSSLDTPVICPPRAKCSNDTED